MKSFIFLLFILISTQTNSFGNPVYILEVYKNGDTINYTYKKFIQKIQLGQISEIEEKIKQAEKDIQLKEKLINRQEENIKTQKIEITSLIFGVFGFVSFPLFIIFLILYIVTKRKLKKISLE